MVIYHIMNYFSTAGPKDFQYVRFVTGSFIFLSGYIISTFYESKYREDRLSTAKRLIVRGIKLLIIFSCLNILINLSGIGNPKKVLAIRFFFENIFEIYTLGKAKLAAFQILLPISYLLIISPLFLFLADYKKYIFTVILFFLFYLSIFQTDSINLDLGAVGLIGLSIGLLINNIDKIISIKSRMAIIGLIIVTICLMGYLNGNLISYSLGIMIILKLFYDFGLTINLEMKFNRGIILLGQYTLVCYIMQIVFLQGLYRLLSKPRWGWGCENISILIATSGFLLGLCMMIRYLRKQHKFMDRSYRFIFS